MKSGLGTPAGPRDGVVMSKESKESKESKNKEGPRWHSYHPIA
jgi:hypothetical protein